MAVVWYEESWAEGAAEPPGGRSPPMQAQPADFAEGERRPAVGVESRELIIKSAAMSPGLRGRWPG